MVFLDKNVSDGTPNLLFCKGKKKSCVLKKKKPTDLVICFFFRTVQNYNLMSALRKCVCWVMGGVVSKEIR